MHRDGNSLKKHSMSSLDAVLTFQRLLNEFRTIERVIRVNGEDRWENDVEHSYQLAMLAWMLVNHLELDLDITKVLQYALVHDLVEVYAGDTFFIERVRGKEDDKMQRERKARQTLKDNFPECTWLHTIINAYESGEDAESAFVYALDKVQPILNIYLDNGRTWQEKGIALDQLHAYKEEKVARSSAVASLYKELYKRLKEQPELFTEVKTEAYEKYEKEK